MEWTAHPREHVAHLLAEADIAIDGPRPWDMQVRDATVYSRLLAHGSLALGETWMEGAWDCADLAGMLARLLAAHLDEHVRTIDDLIAGLHARLVNLQHGQRAWAVAREHYDIGNDLFKAMLGRRMVYSCGYWRQASDLDTAQEAKLDLICRKLLLVPGMRVLDIGCGWGEALKFAAERYGVEGLGITLSREQYEYARTLCAGLPVEIRLQDYHELGHAADAQRFDRVWSVGMFEHVGVRNYPAYFDCVTRCLHPEGLSLLHCIGGERSTDHTDPWIARHIFPNSMLPSAQQIAAAVEGRFVIEDWHNFGTDYERTLLAWRENIEAAWPALPARYDERFRRMWRYYLAASIAGFRTRRNQLWQIVLSPRGVPGGYLAAR
ncbi:MAG: cyclopropane fatty acyl phospholipid synthase [Proteobacteria bacterium]|nr:cyclopropane fatty acyl phospholipid synthase [Pseudomonadota bacterium]